MDDLQDRILRLRETTQRWRRKIDESLPVLKASSYGVCVLTVGGLAAMWSIRQQGLLRRSKTALRRAESDLESTRRMAQIAKRDVENAKQFATQRFAKDILAVSDSLRLAQSSIQELRIPPEHQGLVLGYEVLANQLDSALSANGVEAFGQPGETFDPSKHEAIASTSQSNSSLLIDRVHSVGFQLNGRVIRAAAVTVSSADDLVNSKEENLQHTSDSDSTDQNIPLFTTPEKEDEDSKK